MKNTNAGKDTQPQHISNEADTSSALAGASSQPPEQVMEDTHKTTAAALEETTSAPAHDEVLEASLESFPASDPPSWASGSA